LTTHTPFAAADARTTIVKTPVFSMKEKVVAVPRFAM